MNISTVFEKHVSEIKSGDKCVFLRKARSSFRYVLQVPGYLLAVPLVLVMRLLRPWLIVRVGYLLSSRIGHFAANTELYLCERAAGINVPARASLDLFFFVSRPLCNKQLAILWKKVLTIWPAWILAPVYKVNGLIPWGDIHVAGQNTQHDRDVHNLLDRFPPHLTFTPGEVARGDAGLATMGIPKGAPYVCLAVRDSAYLAHHFAGNGSYHNYRDSDIQNYVLAAEELGDQGYYVIRMGAVVNKAMETSHPMVIDYASNGMRSDFMDIYLGANCHFCISVGTGFDAVPLIFRRPIAYVNLVPIGYLFTFRSQFIGITRHYFKLSENRELTLREIFDSDLGFSLHSDDYLAKDAKLIENTPEEIRDLVIEMAERLGDKWQPHKDDESLQKRFCEIFPTDAVDRSQGRPLHGEIRARFGAQFLRDNQEWLQ